MPAKTVATMCKGTLIFLLALFCLVALVNSAGAQVLVAVSPQPQAVMNSLHVRSMGMWTVFVRNNGPAARTLSADDVMIAALPIRPIAPENAVTVLNDRQSHSTPAKLAKAASLASQLTGIALGLVSHANLSWAAGLTLGGGAAQQLLPILTGEVQSTAPFTSGLLTQPVTLAPGATARFTVFADKTKSPAAQTFTIP